jgi:hypothetical protein
MAGPFIASFMAVFTYGVFFQTKHDNSIGDFLERRYRR